MYRTALTTEYIDPASIKTVSEIFKKEMICFDDIRAFFFNVKDVDKSKDLEESDSDENVNINAVLLFDIESIISKEIEERFPRTIEFIKNMPGVRIASCIAISPKSKVPLHLDNMEKPAYELNDWYAVLIGIKVSDNNLIGLEIDNQTCIPEEGESIIFDTQLPHKAWNDTDTWWISLRLNIKKEFFKS